MQNKEKQYRMDWHKYKFRSHWVGNIVSVPAGLTDNQKETLESLRLRDSGEGRPLTDNQKKTLIELEYKLIKSSEYKLTPGQEKSLNELYFYEKYNRRNDLDFKQLKKGLEVEKLSRDLLSKITGMYFTSNPENRSNDWVTGTTDVKPTEGIVIDIKSAWTFESYSNILRSTSNDVYLRQLDCYMELWECEKSLLCHVLIDTPFQIINDELKRQSYKYNWLDFEGEVKPDFIPDIVDIVSNHIYSREALYEFCLQSTVVDYLWFTDFKEVPENERVHMIYHEFNIDRIKQRNKCIELAREYLSQVKPMNNIISL